MLEIAASVGVYASVGLPYRRLDAGDWVFAAGGLVLLALGMFRD